MASSDLETTMLNNIEFHYIKYVNHYLYNHLHKIKTNSKSNIYKVRNHIICYHACPEEFIKWVQDHKSNIIPTRDNPSFDKDISKRPWVYLNKMVYMMFLLE